MTTCRCCGGTSLETVLSLAVSPLANHFLTQEELAESEDFYPLNLVVCQRCYMAQLDQVISPKAIFTDYAYFSSWSSTWLTHAERYVEKMTDFLSLDDHSLVIEIASNDGYLLQYFRGKGVPVLGIEPAKNVAEHALKKGIPTITEFWDCQLAQKMRAENRRADLIVANNVVAHVPALHDFIEGIYIALKPGGVLTLEFPHVYRMIEENQFDTIYHEHYSYFSMFVIARVLEDLPTHGGSLRVYATPDTNQRVPFSDSVEKLIREEKEKGLMTVDYFKSFGARVERVKRDLLAFCIEAKNKNKRIVAYGAAAKGNTLLNYCGIRQDMIDYVMDRSPSKQGRYTPGTRIPIVSPSILDTDHPDYILILPWNIKDEIEMQLHQVREWGGKFVTAIPSLEVF